MNAHNPYNNKFNLFFVILFTEGNVQGRYFDTGKGHAFYHNNDPRYSFHENQNQGFRRYQDN